MKRILCAYLFGGVQIGPHSGGRITKSKDGPDLDDMYCCASGLCEPVALLCLGL